MGCSDPGSSERASASSGGSSAGSPSSSGGSSASNAGGGGSAASAQAGTATGGASSGGSSGSGGASTGGTAAGGSPTLLTCDDAPVDTAPGPEWVNSTGNLANMASSCGTVGKVLSKPCSSAVFATVANAGVWSTTDRGQTWTALGTGAGSVPILNHAFAMMFDPEHYDVIWESGLHNGSGAYTSTDAGVTFTRLGTMTDSQAISVDFTDPARKTMMVGTHGFSQAAYLSTDSGVSWNNVGLNVPTTASHTETPLIIDSTTYLLGCNQGDSGWGIYRTTDSGATWAMKADYNVSHFGGPLFASSGSIFWPIWNDTAFPKSTDLGETWTNIAENGEVVGITPIELPDGSIVVVGKDHLLRSKDDGATFTPIGDPLPYNLAVNAAGSVTYNPLTKTFFLSHWECTDNVATNAIMSAGFDYTL
ncbi:MAG TPA: hypothetical protein VGP93_02550 [Polyangiaceae bacterium]|nr:hypothetical protein [Polyangiaceae bacterium]